MSAISDVPHGAGLSVIMPAWMQWYQSQRPAQFKRFAKEIFGLDKAEDGILALKLGLIKSAHQRVLNNLVLMMKP